MSLKKELLSELSEQELEKFLETRHINFTLSNIQKKYYKDKDTSEKLIDIINDKRDISIKDVEEYIKMQRKS
jgi:uncharacterized ubiquitin-like protein YukD